MNVITLQYPESQTKNWIPLDLDQVFNIVLHHPQAVTASPEDINNWHLASGWNGGGGYNEYIRKDGTVYIMRGDHIGAQAQGHNSTSYGICAEGDYNKELLMPEVQKKALIERIIFNKARFKNYKTTVPHWYFTDTICPGKYFPISEILRKIEVINLSIEEALKVLADNGVIVSADYWLKVLAIVKFFDMFVINCAKKIVELKG